MSSSIHCYVRAYNEDTARQIQELREKLGDALLAHCIGVKRLALDWQRQPMPVHRAVQYLYALVFHPPGPVRLIDILTSFKYAKNPPQMAQGVAPVVEAGENL
jgi:hypothetical protein